MNKVSIIGVGRMGGALALALSQKGYSIENLVAKNPQKIKQILKKLPSSTKILKPPELEKINSSEIIFITTQDDKISEVVSSLSEKLAPRKTIFHTSGSLSSKVLSPLRDCYTASIHPLISVSDALTGSGSFEGAFFCLEGDRKALVVAKKIVSELGGTSFSIRTEDKPLYHAAAVISAGHVVALFQTAVQTLSTCGIREEKAKIILTPLLKSVIKNLENQSTQKALTGTFARADFETMHKHLDAMQRKCLSDTLQIYARLGLVALELSKRENPKLQKHIKKMEDELRSLLLKK